jgi:hypothetical protein
MPPRPRSVTVATQLIATVDWQHARHPRNAQPPQLDVGSLPSAETHSLSNS